MSIEDRLVRLIETGGPIPLSTYMQLALHDPQAGYYAARPGIGRDFTTAPETSQVFGELIGVWLVHEWRALGTPEAFQLVEIGPGRGQLMLDALRVAGAIGGEDFLAAMRLVFVEPSPVLAAALGELFAPSSPAIVARLAEVPDGPALIVANEYLDCLPARQFRKAEGTWRECVVGLAEGKLAFGLAADEPRPPHGAAFSGDVVEVQTGLDLVVADVVSRKAPVRALFIDYGPDDRAPGDTLRAYREGKQVSPLEAPGLCDLTVDVDFGRLARLAGAAGLDVAGPTPQGMFLLGLGAQARINQLVAANPDDAGDVFDAAKKLIDPAEMGARFKAICLSSKGLAKPAGF
ncbi:MAG: SAM-dependent methyltransferase [Hyphomonas sp.]